MSILFILWVSILQVTAETLQFQLSDQTSEFRNHSKHFSWNNCDGQNLPLHFLDVKMLPDPLQLSGENSSINFRLHFNLTTILGADGNAIEADLSLRLKTPTGYTEICNIVGDYICHYNNICTTLAKTVKECEKYKLDFCTCPFKPKEYETLPLTIALKPLPFLLKGTFEGTIAIKQQAKTVGCLEIHFCVTECMF